MLTKKQLKYDITVLETRIWNADKALNSAIAGKVKAEEDAKVHSDLMDVLNKEFQKLFEILFGTASPNSKIEVLYDIFAKEKREFEMRKKWDKRNE